MLTLYQSFETS